MKLAEPDADPLGEFDESLGGYAGLRSPWIADFLQLAIVGYTSQPLYAPEDKPGRAMSALFVADGAFDPDGVGKKFEDAAIELPAKVKGFVLEKIRAYSPPQP